MINSPASLALALHPVATIDDVGPALEAALNTILERLEIVDAIVAVIGEDRTGEWRATPALEANAEELLDTVAGDGDRTNGSGAGHAMPRAMVSAQDLTGASLEIGDGRRAIAIAVRTSGRQPIGERAFRAAVEPVLLTVARAGLIDRDRRRSSELTRLLATAKRVAASLELDTVLSAIVQDAVALLNADSGDILLWDREPQKLRVVAVASFPPDMLGFEMDFGEGLSSQAILAQRTLEVEDYRTYEHRITALDKYDFGSVLCSPLLFRGSAIGAINVHARTPRHPFQAGDADLLQAFAGLAAIAIDHARQYENEVRLGRELSETNRELVRSLSLQQRLTDQVLLGGGLSAVAAELARVIDRPVVIQDHLWRPIVGAMPDGNEGWRSLAMERPDLRPHRRNGRAERQPADPDRGWEATDGRLVVPIRVGHDLVGHLVIGWEGAFGPVDRALVHIAATCSALEFARVQAAIDVEQRVRGDVVVELLQGRFSSEETISLRAARLGYDLADPRDVFVIDAAMASPHDSAEDSVRRERRLLEILGEHLDRHAPGSIAAAIGGSIAVLATERRRPHLSSAPQLGDDLQRLVKETVGADTVAIGIGDRCRGPADYPASYRLARESLDVMAKLGNRDVVVGPDELGAYRVLIKTADRRELEAFARSVLRPLVEHDERTRGGLVDTLRAYLAEGHVQRRTAERLFVHVNTVVYRLHRIEELLGRDLEDPDTVFELSLALRILDLVAATDPDGLSRS